MPDLILRPSGQPHPKDWALQLRFHDCAGPTEYVTLWRGSERQARAIVNAGAPTWLFGDPAEVSPQRTEEGGA